MTLLGGRRGFWMVLNSAVRRLKTETWRCSVQMGKRCAGLLTARQQVVRFWRAAGPPHPTLCHGKICCPAVLRRLLSLPAPGVRKLMPVEWMCHQSVLCRFAPLAPSVIPSIRSLFNFLIEVAKKYWQLPLRISSSNVRVDLPG